MKVAPQNSENYYQGASCMISKKNRTPSQRRPYKNTKVFMILHILYEDFAKKSIQNVPN